MIAIFRAGVAALALLSGAGVTAAEPFDAAKVFGAREAVSDVSLSPDGKKIAYIVPTSGTGSALLTVDLDSSDAPKRALADSGDPDRLQSCNWVSDNRLTCLVYGVLDEIQSENYSFSRIFALDANGGNVKLLSNRAGLGGGAIIDRLPDEDGVVMMVRGGMGVDRVDTRTGKSASVSGVRTGGADYISDGRGNVRIIGYSIRAGETWQDRGIIRYYFRKKDGRDWLPLSSFDWANDTGFNPQSVDFDRDVVYGLQKKDGRWAAYEMPLDGTNSARLIFAHPDVDVGGFVYVGRHHRMVGVSYSTDKVSVHYTDPVIAKLQASLERALPGKTLMVTDASRDENRLLLFVSSDIDPGAYYLFDRSSRQMAKVLDVRPQLATRPLAEMKSVRYPAADGTMIPAYLQVPVGAQGKKVPAIVMPHGGPSSRDYWGFDWLSAFFVSRGYAVLQPQFRGSAGYGDAWFQKNGFQSWKTAIGDVNDAGRWLVRQGITDASQLAIFGWSYGGYAALQSAVTEPGLFRAVVAVAPVTDLNELKNQSRGWSDFRINSNFIGSGPVVVEGSPARHADRISVPVLLVHGTKDLNVDHGQSRLMNNRLTSAGVPHEFISFPKLDHNLVDSTAREQMLRKSDEFIRKAIGM